MGEHRNVFKHMWRGISDADPVLQHRMRFMPRGFNPNGHEAVLWRCGCGVIWLGRNHHLQQHVWRWLFLAVALVLYQLLWVLLGSYVAAGNDKLQRRRCCGLH